MASRSDRAWKEYGGHLVAALLGREVVAEVAKVLAPHRIAVMPLKGVLLHRIVYEDEAMRPISDVDVLVPRARHRDAVRALTEAGYVWEFAPPGDFECAMMAPSGMRLDLHFRLFPAGQFGMDEAGVFARALRDTALYGAEVCVPDVRDVYAYMVGQFAGDHGDAHLTRRLAELGLVSSRLGLDAGRIAAHLDALGLGRAARYTLRTAVEACGDRFAAEVLARLRPDPVGDALAWASRALVARAGQKHPVSSAVGHVVNRSLPAGALSAGRAAVHRLRARSIGCGRARARRGV